MPVVDWMHVTLAADRRRDVFAAAPVVCAAVHELLRLCAPRLAAFYLGGDHGHLLMAGQGTQVARAAQDVRRSWTRMTGVAFEAPRIRPVQGRRHLDRLWRYIARQGQHHGYLRDDALHVGSSVGFAMGTAWTAEPLLGVAVVPGWSLERQLEVLGLGTSDVRPATIDEVRRYGVHAVDGAARRALLASTAAGRRDPLATLARRAMMQLHQRAGLPRRAVSAVLDVPESSLRRWLEGDVPPEAMMAVLRRVRLEHVVQRRRHESWLRGDARPAADEARHGAHS